MAYQYEFSNGPNVINHSKKGIEKCLIEKELSAFFVKEK